MSGVCLCVCGCVHMVCVLCVCVCVHIACVCAYGMCVLAYVMCTSLCTPSEAVIRFLKAKLRVMQEEMDRLYAKSNENVSQTDVVMVPVDVYAILLP